MTNTKILAVTLSLAAFAASAAAPVVRADRMDRFGGLVMKPAKGTVTFYDYQSKISAQDMLGFFLVENGIFKMNFVHKKMDGAFSIAQATKTMSGSAAAIFVVDDPALPMSLLALEDRWGLVNVAQISADRPKILALLRRAEKLFTRVGTGVLGGHHCLQVPFSAMKPVYSVADLDAMDAKAIAPASLTQITYTLPKLGIEQARPCSYEQACVEGWAPAPTNDVQREIWNDVKNPANRFKKDLPDLKKK